VRQWLGERVDHTHRKAGLVSGFVAIVIGGQKRQERGLAAGRRWLTRAYSVLSESKGDSL
jgi:hypothetical protein